MPSADATTARPAPPGLFAALASDDELSALAHHMAVLGWHRWAWCVGLVFDVFGLWLVWPGASWRVVLGCRLIGAPLHPLLTWLARSGRLPATTVGLLALFSNFIFVALMARQGVEFGGLNSPYLFGLTTFVMASPLVAEVRRSRLYLVVLTWFVIWTAMLVAVVETYPAVARQWRDVASVATYFGEWVLIAAVYVVGMEAAMEIGTLRRQLREARKLAGYRLKLRLGAGGMNEVWLAWDEVHERDVALKILHDAPSSAVARRFEREAEALRALSSPHTVRVLDFGASDDGVRFLAMERLVGIDLDRLVRESGPLPPARAVHLVRQACSSLGEAHAAGIVHRDVKPSNLFLGEHTGGDHLTVIDFGIARRVDTRDARLTATGDAIGTPHFIAPESLLGDDSDARGDLYGLGATLYFLLTGTRPFEGLSGLALVGAISSARPDPPSSRAPAVSARLDAVVLRCLAAVPAQRFSDMATLDTALGALDLAWSAEEAAAANARTERRSAAPGVHDEATRPEHRPSVRPGPAIRMVSSRPPPPLPRDPSP